MYTQGPNGIPFVTLTDMNGTPVSVGGGSGSGGLSDTILTDDSNTQFLARDNGTTITYVTLAGAPYTPSMNIRAVAQAGGATSALQTVGNTALMTIAAGTPALHADGGTPVHVNNFPATQPVAGTAAVGSPPTNPPLSIAGVDASGNKQHLQIVAGRAIVDGSQVTQPVSGPATDAQMRASAIPTVLSNPSAIHGNAMIVTSTPQALPNQALVNGVTIQPGVSNAGSICIGGSGMTAATGYPLASGQPFAYACTNANQVFVVLAPGVTGSCTIAWTGN